MHEIYTLLFAPPPPIVAPRPGQTYLNDPPGIAPSIAEEKRLCGAALLNSMDKFVEPNDVACYKGMRCTKHL